jgi:hypothetical protein
MGFEPTYDGFANRCLTIWLPRRTLGGLKLSFPGLKVKLDRRDESKSRPRVKASWAPTLPRASIR